MPDIENSIMDFVAEFTGIGRHRLSLSSTLFGDLGVAGADGFELIEAFGEKFGVDLSGFQTNLHFGPEGMPIYAPFVWLWRLVIRPFLKTQTPEERADLEAIRISDLVTAANEKRWVL